MATLMLFMLIAPMALTLVGLAAKPPISSKIDPNVVEDLRSGKVSEFVVILKEPDWSIVRELSKAGGRAAVVSYLRAHAELIQAKVEYLVRYGGGTVLRKFWIVNAILVRGTLRTANVIAASPYVKKIIPNFEVHVIEPISKAKVGPKQSVESWGISKIRAPEAWDEGYTGEGVRIAIIDTGVDITHPALQGKMLTTDPSDPHYPGGWMEFDEDGNPVCSEPHDTDGHGTHTSGTALGGDTEDVLIGVAPGATLMHALVLPGGSGTFAQVMAGIEWAVDPYNCDGTSTGLPAHVISMSLGASNYYGNYLLPAIKAAIEANIVVVAAIGNDGPGTSSNPGNVWGVFGIGATDQDDNVADFSSGEVVNWPDPPSDWPFYDTYPSTYVKPDFSAPGVGITSSVPGGGYESWSGTSMATPHVAGTVALILQAAGWTDFSHPDTPEAVYEILNQTVPDLGDPGQDTRYGWGRIDAYEAVELAKQFAKKTGVEGHVYDSYDNSPIPWATVTVLETNETIEVNDEGYFKIPLDPGNYTLLIQAWGYESQTLSVEVVSGNGTIAGTVQDYVTGDPIAGALINISNGSMSWVTYTNSSGAFSVEVPAGTYEVFAGASGYVNQTKEVSVAEDEVALVSFTLVKESDLATLYGWVKDASTGDPVDGATVRLVEAGLETVTGADGYYEFTNVLPGNYTLEINASGYEPYTQLVELGPGAVVENNVSLTPSAAPGGVAIVGNVHYYTEPHLDQVVEEVLGVTPVMYDNVSMIMQDLRSGASFDLIIVDHIVRAYSISNFTEILEFLNRTKDAGIPVIFLSTSYSSMGGIQALYQNDTYFEAYGYPAPDERSYGYPAPSYVKVYVPQDLAGAAIFNGIEWDGTDGNFTWFYLADLGESSYADYDAYNFTDDLGIAPLAFINDTYNGKSGVGLAIWSPAPGLYWYYLASWGESYWMQYYEPGSDGMYSNNTLTLLKNVIFLAASGASPLAKTPSSTGERRLIKPSRYTTVEVYLEREPWGTLEGYVHDTEGHPLAGAKVTIEGAPFIIETDASGHFSHWLPTGTYTVTVTKEGYTSFTTTVTITEGATITIDAELRKLTWIAVMYDYAGSLKSLIESRLSGVYVKDFSDWESLHDEVLAGGYDVVIFAGYYYAADPEDPTLFTDVVEYMNESGKGLIFLDSWGNYAYGIRLLNIYYGDPGTREYDYNNGYVYYIVERAHPIFRGYSVGQKIYIVLSSDADYAWFGNFSGTKLASIGADSAGVVGDGVAVKEFSNGAKWALLATLVPTQWNTIDDLSEDAKKILINAIVWMSTKALNVSVSPSTAVPGDEVTVTVSGGEPGLEVAIYFNTQHIGNITLGSDGEGVLSFTVPTVPGGTYTVEAVASTYYGSATLTVVAGLVVTPSTVAQAKQFTARLVGADALTKYYLFIDGNMISFFITDINGTAETVINVPYYIGSGTHAVRIVAEDGNEIAEASISVIRGELYTFLNNKFSNIEELIQSLTDEVSGLRSMLEAMNVTLAENSAAILEAIGSAKTSIEALIASKTGEVLVAINTSGGVILARLDDIETAVGNNAELVNDVKEMLANVNESLTESVRAAKEATVSELSGIISNYTGYLVDVINDSSLGVIGAIKSSETLIVANLSKAFNDIVGIIETKTGDLYALLDTKFGVIAANITTLKELTGNKFDEVMSKLGEIRDSQDSMYSTIQTEAGTIKAKIDALNDQFRSGTEEIKGVADAGSRNALIAAILSAGALLSILGIAFMRRF